MKPRNKEDVKPFDLELARAGHPICQRCLLPAGVMKFDAKGSPYTLIGWREYNSSEIPAKWTSHGYYSNEDDHYFSLVLAPLGYCQDKPVFGGDKLINSKGEEFIVTISIHPYGWLEQCTLPRKEPVMPQCKAEFTDDMLCLMQAGIAHMLRNQVDEVIDYLVESGKVVRVKEIDENLLSHIADQLEVANALNAPAHSLRLRIASVKTIIEAFQKVQS